jgi:hypothetical protein
METLDILWNFLNGEPILPKASTYTGKHKNQIPMLQRSKNPLASEFTIININSEIKIHNFLCRSFDQNL